MLYESSRVLDCTIKALAWELAEESVFPETSVAELLPFGLPGINVRTSSRS